MSNHSASEKDSHTISESLPSRFSKSIELDLTPQSESLPSRFSKSIEFNLTITNKTHFKRFLYVSALLLLTIPALLLLLHFFPHKKPPSSSSKNLTLAINQALLFFDAHKSVPYLTNNPIKFRGNSGIDLVGGFYDSGKNIKFSSTIAYTVTLLSWTVIEYHQKYAYIGELDHVKNIIRWGSDYLLKLYVHPNITSAILYSQVGGDNETPEDMTYTRTISVCDLAAADLAGEIVAGMSAASIVFREDKTYSEKLARAAESLFIMTNSTANKTRHTTCKNTRGVKEMHFYNCTRYKDEMVWGETWLYFATGNESYLKYATDNFMTAKEEEGIFYWNNKITATTILLTRIRFFRDLGYPYEHAFASSTSRADSLMCSYTTNQRFGKTEGGLRLLKPDDCGAPLQYAATASFLGKLYSDYLELLYRYHGSCNGAVFSLQNVREFSMSQVNYILGDNPMKMSYLDGFGERIPFQAHHRSSSIRWDDNLYSCSEGDEWLKSKDANPNVVAGAMVAGSDESEGFRDERKQQWFTEPSISSNAGLVAALIALHDPPPSKGVNLGLDKLGLFDKVN